jgi:lipid-A-disaccharide synthase
MQVMISCGEASGDLYAGALAAEIRRLEPGAAVFGIGGEGLQQAGGELVADFHGLSVTGLSEAVSVLPRSLAAYRRLLSAARARRPDVFVAIDFPDFNFRLGAALHRMGIPVVYYIGPQLWAWRAGRLATMKRFVSEVLVIFPFEEAIYRDAGVPVQFVGHPLLDLLTPVQPRAEFLSSVGLDPSRPTVALLPGSRPNEVRAILPDLVRAAGLVAGRVPAVQFLVARPPALDESHYGALRDPGLRARLPIATVQSRTDEVLSASDLALTASGTATVQAAIHGCPMVIVYRLSALTYRFGKPFVRVQTYGMANLIAGERIVPELSQDAFTPEAVAAEAIDFLTNARRAADTRQALARVREKLGGPGASRRAAEAVLRVASRRSLQPVS